MGRYLFLALIFVSSLFSEVTAIYLSWYQDPTTTMTIQWISPKKDPVDEIFFEGKNGNFSPIKPSKRSLDYLYVYQVDLDHLKPDTEYSFKVDKKLYRFKTAPKNLKNNLRFAIGGDLYERKKLFHKMNETVSKENPLFVVIGGDIAYAIGVHPFQRKSTALKKWVGFLSSWFHEMVGENHRLIPFLLVPGNHDIQPDNYELFFSLFAFPEKQLYRAVDFGGYLTLFLLDTGHFQPIKGRQSHWLKKALSSRNKIPYRFAIYHEGAYPSFYNYHGAVPKMIRTHWVPLFDTYKITAAFEHHNHALKKTYPLKNNRIDPEEGIIYFGDGSWGVNPRRTNDMWYLERREKKNSFYLVELSKQRAEIKALDITGNILFETSILPNK